MKNKSIILFFLPLIFLFFYLIVKSYFRDFADFAAYYFGGKLLLEQNYEVVYNTLRLNEDIIKNGYENVLVSYTPFPPFTSIVFYPFLIFPIAISKLLFNIFSAMIFVFSLFRTFKYFSISSFYALLIPLIFFLALNNNILFGQSYLLLFSLLMEGYMAYEKKNYLLSSVFWAIAILFKVFPGVILIFLILRKEYKPAILLSCCCMLLLVSSILVNGLPAWKFYIIDLFPRLNNGELNDSFTYIFQSAFMLLKNIFVKDALINPNPFINSAVLFVISLALFKSFFVGIVACTTIKKEKDTFFCWSLWIFASMLISPNGSIYSIILLLIPFLALIKSEISKQKKIIVLTLILLITNTPVHYFHNLPLLLKFPRLYLLVLFFMILVSISDFRLYLRYIFAFFIVFIVLDIKKIKADKDLSSYVLPKEEHILISDYKIDNNSLVYSYLTVEGKKSCLTDFKVYNWNRENVEIKNNQLFYQGKQITDSKDFKDKPMQVNDKYIIYLSDKNRGVGFYTLRIIKI